MTKPVIDNPHYYKRFEGYKPIAVRQYHEDDQTRYEWGKGVKGYDDELCWFPALGDEHYHMSFGGAFLMSKANAQAEAKRLAAHLAKAKLV